MPSRESHRERYLARMRWDQSPRERRYIDGAPRVDPDKALPVLLGALAYVAGAGWDEGRGALGALHEARCDLALLPTDERHAASLLCWMRQSRTASRTRAEVLKLLRDAVRICGGRLPPVGGRFVSMGPGRVLR